MRRPSVRPSLAAALAGLSAVFALSAPAFAESPTPTAGPANEVTTVAKPEVAAPASSGPAAAPPAVSAPIRRRTPSPLMAELFAALDAERLAVAALRERLAATRDAQTALALQREIETVKHEAEIGLLRIQSRHARANGRVALADELDRAIVEMTAPPLRGAPTDTTEPAAAPAGDGR